ncbi:putative 2OG-Fe(II) oxygenase [Brevundimonas kwangchunensis]
MGAANTGAATISGAWSVLLNAGGWHSDHVHPQGWISSAFYVAVPDSTPAEPVGGWLRFGATQLGPNIELPAEHRIEPQPGRLALFPAFFWHGTEPFSGDGERLTLAFDAIPA